MTAIIGLLGPAGVGKSTVANHLVVKYGAAKFSLAAPLKEIAKRTLDFTDEQLYGTQEQKETIDPRYGFSCRTFLQKLGTEGIRNVLGKDFWTNFCLGQISNSGVHVAVIDDVRFSNEVDEIRRDGGYIWKLCPFVDDETLERAQAAGKHASEQEWQEISCVHQYHPVKRGVPELLAFADECAAQMRLFPKRRAVSL